MHSSISADKLTACNRLRTARMDKQVSYQHQLILRFIELRALWEGQINASHLMQEFGIGRDLASSLIKKYDHASPGNLNYNASTKGYEPSRDFVPQYSNGSLEQYLIGFQAMDLPENTTGLQSADMFPMRQFERHPEPEIVRHVLSAIRQQRRLDISYLSVSSTDYEDRIISPHNLVHNGMRWHARAWCEKNQEYRDYVLSRIKEVYNDEGAADKTAQQDHKWNTFVDVTIEPDIRLKSDKKAALAFDFCMTQDQQGRYTRSYSVRAANVIYVMRHLGLDRLRDKSEAQQVMLTPESAEAVEPYWR
ncbi:MAG: WYL domain-containing protein [Pelagibaca sp.]|nr:WYL domain-containing protein [Pelagibaca sp.]